jgi:hypothetical protein
VREREEEARARLVDLSTGREEEPKRSGRRRVGEEAGEGRGGVM